MKENTEIWPPVLGKASGNIVMNNLYIIGGIDSKEVIRNSIWVLDIEKAIKRSFHSKSLNNTCIWNEIKLNSNELDIYGHSSVVI